MHIISLSEVTWVYKPEAGVTVGRSPLLPCNEFADVVYAKIEPGGTLYRHYHIRPAVSGYIACFLFRGGHIELLQENGRSERMRFDEPVHITFLDREVHGIKNISSDPLLFEVICAPQFEEGEEIRDDLDDE